MSPPSVGAVSGAVSLAVLPPDFFRSSSAKAGGQVHGFPSATCHRLCMPLHPRPRRVETSKIGAGSVDCVELESSDGPQASWRRTSSISSRCSRALKFAPSACRTRLQRSTASWHISHGSAFGDAGRRGLASRASRCARCRATSHCRASSVRRAQMFERFRVASSCSSSYRAIVLRWRHCTHPARLVFVNCAMFARRAQSKIGRRIGHALISAVGSRSRFNHLLSPSAHLCACLAGACGRWSETSQAKLFLAAKRRRPDGAKNPGRLTQVLTVTEIAMSLSDHVSNQQPKGSSSFITRFQCSPACASSSNQARNV